MKYGTDKIETIVPVGILANTSIPITIMSEIITKIPAMTPLAGIKTRVSVPTSRRAICGAIRPKKRNFRQKQHLLNSLQRHKKLI